MQLRLSLRTSLRLACLWGLVLALSSAGAALAAGADEALERAVLRDRDLPLTPPALVLEGRIFVPLNFVVHGLGLTATAQPGGREWLLSFFDRRARFTLGQTRAAGPAGEIALAAAPFEATGGAYVPVELLRRAFGLVLERSLDAQGLPVLRVYSGGAQVLAARGGSHPDRERLVLDLDAETCFDWQYLGDQVELYLAPPATSTLCAQEMSLQGFGLRSIREVARSVSPEGFALVRVSLQGETPPSVFTLSDPPRIVVDVPLGAAPLPLPELSLPLPNLPPPPPREGRPLWKIQQFTTKLGVVNAYVLRMSQSDPRWTLQPALAGETLGRRRSLLAMVREAGGVAGLNAGYFAWEGPPVGLVVINGEWICTPAKPLRRTSLAISKDGTLSMGRWQFKGRVTFGDHGSMSLTGINRGHQGGDELIMYTRRFGTSLPGNSLYTRLTVGAREECVTLKETAGRPVDIPTDGYVISGRGKYAELLRKIDVAESVRRELGTDPPLPGLWSLLEGGPRCMVDGAVCNYAEVESFQADVRTAAASRSAVGITKDGQILLVAVESPGTERGGVYLDEMAAIMKKLGAYQAMNWDGGGSTTVVEGDRIINRAATSPRPLATALVVVPRG
jgi:hypothetical protein